MNEFLHEQYAGAWFPHMRMLVDGQRAAGIPEFKVQLFLRHSDDVRAALAGTATATATATGTGGGDGNDHSQSAAVKAKVMKAVVGACAAAGYARSETRIALLALKLGADVLPLIPATRSCIFYSTADGHTQR